MSDSVPPPADSLPDTLRELQADARAKRRTIRVVLFGVVPLVAIGIGVLAWVMSQRAAARDIRVAWSRAAACLVGEPLAEGQRASLRVRGIQLAALHDELELPEKERWPSRCADDVATLQVKLREHGRDDDGDEGLAAQAERLAIQLRKARIMDDLSVPIDGLFDAARKRGLHAEPIALTRPTREPAGALDLDALPATARVSNLQYTLDQVSTTPMIGTDLHLLVYDPKIDRTPLLCTFTVDGADRCRKLGGELVGKAGLQLGGTAAPGALPLVFAGRDGEAGIYRADSSTKIAALAASSAYVAADGYVAIASRPLDRDGAFDLVEQRAAGGAIERHTIEAKQFEPKATQIHRKQILWDKLLVQVLDAEDVEASPRLQYTALPSDDADRPFVDIAPLNWVNAAIFGCRTATTTIVRVGVRQGFITFFGAEGWSSPVAAQSFPPAFTCDEGEAVFTDRFGNQQRCTPAGCKQTPGSAPRYEPFDQRDGAVADVGGRILALGLAEGRGGLRYRYAAGKNLADKHQDRILFDDLVRDGAVQKDSVVLGMHLLGRGRFAVLLLSTPAGLYAIRFDAKGQPSPAKITQE
ncbi:MAG: hypothetical protein JRI23_27635 [Deltaproteobacteria bacterium]|jgi:hypothetical protein|nr:hypothetical protein [Deltaproteobacteria bacterium]MBW2535853.1 hypothetical protein [Deltaproteobacteria bacterium]